MPKEIKITLLPHTSPIGGKEIRRGGWLCQDQERHTFVDTSTYIRTVHSVLIGSKRVGGKLTHSATQGL